MHQSQEDHMAGSRELLLISQQKTSKRTGGPTRSDGHCQTHGYDGRHGSPGGLEYILV